MPPCPLYLWSKYYGNRYNRFRDIVVDGIAAVSLVAKKIQHRNRVQIVRKKEAFICRETTCRQFQMVQGTFCYNRGVRL